jgi:hypothetical protein
MSAIEDAVYALSDAGAEVLSPADPRIVDRFGDFVFVASDRVRAIKLVQSRHLAAISASDFVWLVAPDGYIGQSGAMEIGYATASETPIYCSEVPTDLTLRQYVTVMPSPELAIARHVQQSRLTTSPGRNVLLDPRSSVAAAHANLERIESELTRATKDEASAIRAAERIASDIVFPLRSL